MFLQSHQHLPLKENKIYKFIRINTITKFNILFIKFVISIFVFISNDALGFKENYYYEVQFGNLIVGKAHVFLQTKGDEIFLNTKSKTAGFLNVLYEYEGELNSSSIKENNNWLPKVFSTTGTFNDKKRSSKINFQNNIVKYKNNPVLDLKKVHPIEQSTLNEVIDPVTAFINIIEKINSNKKCDKIFKIFDGRRRYNLQIKALGNTFLKNDRPKSFNGKVLVCGLKVTPLGGHRLETKWKPNEDKFTDFKIFFGETSSGRTLPVRMNLERWFGTVIIRLIRDVS